MVMNYGNGKIAQAVVLIIELSKRAMSNVMGQITLLIGLLLVFNIIYKTLMLIANNKREQWLSELTNEIVYGVLLMFFITNWISGLNILGNIIEPLFFKQIPSIIFGFSIGSHPLYTGNEMLLNLDQVWDALTVLPEKYFNIPNGLIIFVDWVLRSNLGITIIYSLFKAFLYIIVILAFGDILRMVLGIHLMTIFMGIVFILMTLKPLRENYGTSILKGLITLSIQYYMVFVLIGIVSGFATSVSISDPIMFIVGLFLIVNTFKGMLRAVNNFGNRL